VKIAQISSAAASALSFHFEVLLEPMRFMETWRNSMIEELESRILDHAATANKASQALHDNRVSEDHNPAKLNTEQAKYTTVISPSTGLRT
jgi:hypothetical protein